VYQALARLPNGPVVELPMVDPAVGAEWNFIEDDRLRYSIEFDYHPRVNGVAPNLPPTYQADVHTLNTFPSALSLQRLWTLRVRYVMLHAGSHLMYTTIAAAQVIAGLPAGASARHFGDAWLVELSS
jgi:hypothetical protein